MPAASTSDLLAIADTPDLGGLPGVRAACFTCGPRLTSHRHRDLLAGHTREFLVAPPTTAVVFAEQVHGHAVASLQPSACLLRATRYGGQVSLQSSVPSVDALATAAPRAALVVRTADCVPILLASAEAPWIAAVHAGWRGTLGRILEKTIDAASVAGIAPRSLHVWIGPHIGAEVYEVSTDLAETFSRTFEPLGFRSDGRRLDLARLNILQAHSRGVAPSNIRASTRCTFRSPGLLPSYRRDGRCRGQIYSAIMLAD